MLMLGFFISPHTPYGRVRLLRFALRTLTSRFTDFFTDFEKKNLLFCSLLERTFFSLSLGCLKHQYYAVKSQYYLVQFPISGS